MLSDVKGVELRDAIKNNPELISYLKLDQLDSLRKNLWLSYIKEEQVKFEELYSKYVMLETEINNVDLDETPWRKALNIFEERFSVPYSMSIANLKSSIIGDSLPSIEFEFKRNENEAHVDRNELERLDVLSQGEKRALYLLNIIFDIEKLKGEDGEKLLVIDDIADSFDYKNKYAIVEYLYEMSKEEGFYLIILSHNFDFYRTVSSRLGVRRKNRLLAEKSSNEIVFSQEKYQNQPFNAWKENRNLVNVLALIPFVRNIIEYGYDKRCLDICNIEGDYLILTHLLHEKENTNEITFNDLKTMYDMYLGEKDFKGDISLSDKVLDKLYEVADRITFTDADLEYKIILSMAIRHKAEMIMLPLIQEYNGTLEWKTGRNLISGDVNMFMEHVENSGNQARELYNAYLQFGEEDCIKILNEVNIMTPENIHLNSFMFEPILDMDIIELINLYEKVKALLIAE